ncbi:MAG: hypothetical protein MJB57_14675 [Gemmatimonadetes bacterium]|nr:hypothetical protein [Gemmatimonadota bacterium]
MPGVAIRVRDALGEGTAMTEARLFRAPLARAAGGADLISGALQRFLAEAVWYPTTLRPSRSLRWSAIDARSAEARLVDGGHTVRLLFEFGGDGLVERVSTPARARQVGKRFVYAPWEGRFGAYHWWNGVLIPRRAEAAWGPPGEAEPYWRGRIEAAELELGTLGEAEGTFNLRLLRQLGPALRRPRSSLARPTAELRSTDDPAYADERGRPNRGGSESRTKRSSSARTEAAR